MAIVSTSQEFLGGGVTWEEGFIWKVSEGLVGGLGMGFEYWAAAAASTSATAATVIKNTKSKKNDHHVQSPARGKINSTSPPPLSAATIETDAATATIFTTACGSQTGGGHDVGMAGEGQDGLGGKWIHNLAAAATHPFVHIVGFLSAYLLVVGFIRSKGFNWRSVKRSIWIWTRLIFLAPIVFSRELHANLCLAAHASDEFLETGISSRGIGGITLVSVEAHAEGRVGERTPRMPARCGPGGCGKKPNPPSFRKRAWKTATNKVQDFVFTLNAFIAWVWDHLGGLVVWAFPPWVAGFFDGLGKSSTSQPSSGTGVVSFNYGENDNGYSPQGPEAESSGKNGKNKGSPKGDNPGGQRKKNGGNGGGKGGGKNKKGRKR